MALKRSYANLARLEARKESAERISLENKVVDLVDDFQMRVSEAKASLQEQNRLQDMSSLLADMSLLRDPEYREVWERYHWTGRGRCRGGVCLWCNEFPPRCQFI